jgi:hypothetical protein
MGWEEAQSRDPVHCPANHNPSHAVEGGGAVKTTYHDGYASRACSQVRRITEGYLRRRGARPSSNVVKHDLGLNGTPALTPPKSEELSPQMGMRTRLRGTQARREDESHIQEAHVAEVSHGEPVIGKPEHPDKPLTTRRWS